MYLWTFKVFLVNCEVFILFFCFLVGVNLVSSEREDGGWDLGSGGRKGNMLINLRDLGGGVDFALWRRGRR